MLETVAKKKNEIAAICRQFGVERLEIFGSAASSDPSRAPGDIDFLVTYPEGYDFGPWMSELLALESALSLALSYPVDLVMPKALENRWFRREAEKTRQVIYDASPIAEVA